MEMVEGVQDGLGNCPAPVERSEHGDAVRAAHRGLAVNGERLGPELRCGPRDRRVTPAPVIASAGEQADGVAVISDNEAIAIVLDLVHPVGPGWRLGGTGGDAGLNEAVGVNRKHGLNYWIVRVSGNPRHSPR